MGFQDQPKFSAVPLKWSKGCLKPNKAPLIRSSIWDWAPKRTKVLRNFTRNWLFKQANRPHLTPIPTPMYHRKSLSHRLKNRMCVALAIAWTPTASLMTKFYLRVAVFRSFPKLWQKRSSKCNSINLWTQNVKIPSLSDHMQQYPQPSLKLKQHVLITPSYSLCRLRILVSSKVLSMLKKKFCLSEDTLKPKWSNLERRTKPTCEVNLFALRWPMTWLGRTSPQLQKSPLSSANSPTSPLPRLSLSCDS